MEELIAVRLSSRNRSHFSEAETGPSPCGLMRWRCAVKLEEKVSALLVAATHG